MVADVTCFSMQRPRSDLPRNLVNVVCLVIQGSLVQQEVLCSACTAAIICHARMVYVVYV
jgi:hypothetical protein